MERIGKVTTMAFRLAVSERETIEALAVEAQCRPSEMLRRLVRQALLAKPGAEERPESARVLPEQRREEVVPHV